MYTYIYYVIIRQRIFISLLKMSTGVFQFAALERHHLIYTSNIRYRSDQACNIKRLHSYDTSSVHQHYVRYWLISVARSDHFLHSELSSNKSDLICVRYAPTPTTVASGTYIRKHDLFMQFSTSCVCTHTP
jgi:hypothetical protein